MVLLHHITVLGGDPPHWARMSNRVTSIVPCSDSPTCLPTPLGLSLVRLSTHLIMGLSTYTTFDQRPVTLSTLDLLQLLTVDPLPRKTTGVFLRRPSEMYPWIPMTDRFPRATIYKLAPCKHDYGNFAGTASTETDRVYPVYWWQKVFCGGLGKPFFFKHVIAQSNSVTRPRGLTFRWWECYGLCLT